MKTFRKSGEMPAPADTLPGGALVLPDTHCVHGRQIKAPFPPGLQLAMFGLGCFWGAERKFWE